ncbi:MAG: hypothetical protein RLZZ401_1216, partial [Pseudomonadota bacterium]
VITEDIVDGADHTFSNFSTRADMLGLIHQRLDQAQEAGDDGGFKTSWYASVFR